MKELFAGPVRVYYENGFLRQFSTAGGEVLRMIYFALRDENWGTYPLIVSEERIRETEKDFTIEYRATNERDGLAVLSWVVRIDGTSEGKITFSLRGTVLHDIRKNRAGFCVLHPLEDVVNSPLEITHPDGRMTTGSFPLLVAPRGPFYDIRLLRWKISRNWYRLAFEGDTFEMEDQRNWGDASFKTFCTPLSIPFPVSMKKGDTVAQQIAFAPEEKTGGPAPVTGAIRLEWSKQKFRFPQAGIAGRPEGMPLPRGAADRIKALALHHYRIDLWPGREGWTGAADQLANEAVAMALQLEVAVHFTENPRKEAAAFVEWARPWKKCITRVMLFSEGNNTTNEAVIAAIPALQAQGMSCCAGTDYNFTEFNRFPMRPGSYDAVTYSIHPQEHAFDDATIIENSEAAYYTASSAGALYPGRKIHVSPLTLRKRYNPYATDPAKRVVPPDLQQDNRLDTPLAAVFILATIVSLARAGVAGVTVLQTVGPHGILSPDGSERPVYSMLKHLAGNEEFEWLHSSHRQLCEAIYLTGSRRALVWNRTENPIDVDLPWGERVQIGRFEVKAIAGV